jgi:adenylate kinase family enzyme
MKVYFVGSHATGKSTLCRYVSTRYDLPMITETARTILSETELQIEALRSDIDIVNTYQNRVFDRQLIEESKHRNFVADRSIIDILAYTAQHSIILPELLQNDNFQDYITNLSSKKSFVFFVRPSLATLKNDGVRETVTWDGIVAIDGMIKLLLELYSIRYFPINTDNMQERVRAVEAILSR